MDSTGCLLGSCNMVLISANIFGWAVDIDWQSINHFLWVWHNLHFWCVDRFASPSDDDTCGDNVSVRLRILSAWYCLLCLEPLSSVGCCASLYFCCRWMSYKLKWENSQMLTIRSWPMSIQRSRSGRYDSSCGCSLFLLCCVFAGSSLLAIAVRMNVSVAVSFVFFCDRNIAWTELEFLFVIVFGWITSSLKKQRTQLHLMITLSDVFRWTRFSHHYKLNYIVNKFSEI